MNRGGKDSNRSLPGICNPISEQFEGVALEEHIEGLPAGIAASFSQQDRGAVPKLIAELVSDTRFPVTEGQGCHSFRADTHQLSRMRDTVVIGVLPKEELYPDGIAIGQDPVAVTAAFRSVVHPQRLVAIGCRRERLLRVTVEQLEP